MALIDVAIVNWNTSEAALAAASAYLASTGVEARVTIVDSASEEEQRRLLEEGRGDSIRLLETGENVGYGSAANRALAGGNGELVCVSNADVLPEADALAELAAAARAEPGAGMVGPVFGGDADSYHAELPRPAALLGQIFVGSFMRRSAPMPPSGRIAEVGQPSGACFLMRRETWEAVGGFDEGFFLWFEDVDLAKRLRESGHRNLVVGSARVGHAGAGSFRHLDPRSQQALRIPSIGRYISKHHRAIAPLAKPLLSLSTLLRTGRAPRRK